MQARVFQEDKSDFGDAQGEVPGLGKAEKLRKFQCGAVGAYLSVQYITHPYRSRPGGRSRLIFRVLPPRTPENWQEQRGSCAFR